MRALRISDLGGPDALELAERAGAGGDPHADSGRGRGGRRARGGGVVPGRPPERGLYQFKPDLPFVPGAEVAGMVRSAPDGSGL